MIWDSLKEEFGKLYNRGDDEEEYEEEEVYQILTESEADPDEGIISDQSAVGKALIGKTVGEIVKVNLPNGNVISFEVLEISK